MKFALELHLTPPLTAPFGTKTGCERRQHLLRLPQTDKVMENRELHVSNKITHRPFWQLRGPHKLRAQCIYCISFAVRRFLSGTYTKYLAPCAPAGRLNSGISPGIRGTNGLRFPATGGQRVQWTDLWERIP